MSRLFFDHVPRTGGSAFCRSVRSALGPGAVVTGNLSGNLSSLLRRFAALPAICGALEYAPNDTLPRDRICATLLRDPVDRVLSGYAFQRHDVLTAGAPQPLAAACRAMSLAECLRSDDPALAEGLRNGQSRHFARLRWDGIEPLDDERLLALALEALESFDVVGVREALPDFVDVAAARLGWGQLPEPEVMRAASHPISRHSLDADTLLAIRDGNAVDAELYRHARARFKRDRRGALRTMLGLVGPREVELAPARETSGSEGAPAAPPPLREFAASIAFVETVRTLECGTPIGIEVEVRNDSAELWLADGEQPVRLSYHWLDAAGGMVLFDGERTRLPYDLGPGDSVRMRAAVVAPDKPGPHVLQMGLVQEGIAWFESQGSPGPSIPVEVITPSASAT